MLVRILIAGAAVAALAACATDYDDNPPGLAGGWGTNWENPPGPQGGPGASPNRYYRWEGERYAFEPRGDYWYNDRFGYYSPDYGWYDQDRRCWREPRWNPPGPRGGPGWGWETPAGIRRC